MHPKNSHVYSARHQTKSNAAQLCVFVHTFYSSIIMLQHLFPNNIPIYINRIPQISTLQGYHPRDFNCTNSYLLQLFFLSELLQWPATVFYSCVTNYYKHNALNLYSFIILQSHQTEVQVGLGGFSPSLLTVQSPRVSQTVFDQGAMQKNPLLNSFMSLQNSDTHGNQTKVTVFLLTVSQKQISVPRTCSLDMVFPSSKTA